MPHENLDREEWNDVHLPQRKIFYYQAQSMKKVISSLPENSISHDTMLLINLLCL
jgi:hypothetical protein